MTRRGFTLVEAAVCIVIVGVMLVASLSVIGSSALSRRKGAELRKAHDLCRTFMGEIQGLPLDDPSTGSATFGPEIGESDAPRAFDDVDDYHNFSELCPTSRDGACYPGYDGWTLSISISRVKVDRTGFYHVDVDTGTVAITITAESPTGQRVQAGALRSRFGLMDQSPGSGQLDASHARLSIQTDEHSTPIAKSVELLNVPDAP